MFTELFWTAFAAIGTTLGSLVTAIAVVIAVSQYRQPLIKKVKITASVGFPVMDNGISGDNYYCISVSNIGARNVNISNVYIQFGRKKGRKLIINDIEVPYLKKVNFPRILEPEAHFEMFLDYETLMSGIRKTYENGEISKSDNVMILVTDNSGGNYYKKIGVNVKKFIT